MKWRACALVAIILVLLVTGLSHDLLLLTHIAIPLRELTSVDHSRMIEEKNRKGLEFADARPPTI